MPINLPKPIPVAAPPEIVSYMILAMYLDVEGGVYTMEYCAVDSTGARHDSQQLLLSAAQLSAFVPQTPGAASSSTLKTQAYTVLSKALGVSGAIA